MPGPRRKKLLGLRFGNLIVASEAPTIGSGRFAVAAWNCLCDCGQSAVVRSTNLLCGITKSCGCLRVPPSPVRHGHHTRTCRSREYQSWAAMRQRCLNPKHKAWPDYGGRGISICARWASFENFLADMGRKPGPGYSIDRKNVHGNYEPSNCRWATASEQIANRRKMRAIENFSTDELWNELKRRKAA